MKKKHAASNDPNTEIAPEMTPITITERELPRSFGGGYRRRDVDQLLSDALSGIASRDEAALALQNHNRQLTEEIERLRAEAAAKAAPPQSVEDAETEQLAAEEIDSAQDAAGDLLREAEGLTDHRAAAAELIFRQTEAFAREKQKEVEAEAEALLDRAQEEARAIIAEAEARRDNIDTLIQQEKERVAALLPGAEEQARAILDKAEVGAETLKDDARKQAAAVIVEANERYQKTIAEADEKASDTLKDAEDRVRVLLEEAYGNMKQIEARVEEEARTRLKEAKEAAEKMRLQAEAETRASATLTQSMLESIERLQGVV
ncbi:MAG: hypothetical protein FWD16_01385 [Clostridia bacterium]|nr:hypothetical protein [Clostridia bacterium]